MLIEPPRRGTAATVRPRRMDAISPRRPGSVALSVALEITAPPIQGDAAAGIFPGNVSRAALPWRGRRAGLSNVAGNGRARLPPSRAFRARPGFQGTSVSELSPLGSPLAASQRPLIRGLRSRKRQSERRRSPAVVSLHHVRLHSRPNCSAEASHSPKRESHRYGRQPHCTVICGRWGRPTGVPACNMPLS